MTSRRYFLGLAMAITVLAGVFGGRLLIDRGVVGSEDNILFYMMGLNLVAAEQLETMANGAIDYYSTRVDDPHTLLRLNFRKTYLNEFPLPGAIYLAISRAFKGLFDLNQTLYPLYLSQVIVFGLTASMALSVVCVVLLVRITRRPLHLWALAFTVLLFALSEYIPVQSNSFATLLMHDGLGNVMAHLGQLLVRPGPQFSPLGFTPRGHFALLMIAVFALRWSNRYGMGYLLLMGLSFVHLSTSAVVLLALLAVDLFLRPSVFRKPQTAAIVLLSLIVVMGRQTMWQLLGENLPLVLGGVGAFSLLMLAVWGVPSLRRSLASTFCWLSPIRNWFIGTNKTAADLRVLTIGWGITFLALFAVIAVFDPFDPLSRFYFWGRLHGRVAAVLWPSLIFGLFVLVSVRVARRQEKRKGLVKSCALIGVLLLAANVYPGGKSMLQGQVLNRVAGDFFKAEQRLYGPPMTNLPPMGFEEKVLYYGMCKSVDLKQNYLQLVLR